MTLPARRQDQLKERQELHCHACNQYVQFTMDMSLNGNHVLNCPRCNHEHCRVVKDGVITEDRWDSRNGPAYQVYGVTASTNSTWTTCTTSTNPARIFLYQSWANSGTSS